MISMSLKLVSADTVVCQEVVPWVMPSPGLFGLPAPAASGECARLPADPIASSWDLAAAGRKLINSCQESAIHCARTLKNNCDLFTIQWVPE
jgi:hypothetical protein